MCSERRFKKVALIVMAMALRTYKVTGAAIFALLFLMSCSNSGAGTDEDYLIRIGSRTTTVAEYNTALELAKTAYPHSVLNDPEEYKKIKTRLLNQLIEELILQERARELGITVTDAEVEQTIAAIKEDYPEDEFEQTLLEFAVPYKTWKEGIRRRLLMEKLVEVELKDQVVISAADIAQYYEEHIKDAQQQPGIDMRPRELDEKIIQHLRRQKIEMAYRTWIEQLQQRYKIDVNRALWEKLLISQS
jgi:hypothetical protein